MRTVRIESMNAKMRASFIFTSPEARGLNLFFLWTLSDSISAISLNI